MRINKLKTIYYRCKYADLLGRHYFDDFKISKEDFENIFNIDTEEETQDILSFLNLQKRAQQENAVLRYTVNSGDNGLSHIDFYDKEKAFVSKKDICKYGIGKDEVDFKREAIYFYADENRAMLMQTRYTINDRHGDTKILSYLIANEEKFMKIYNEHKDEINQRIKQSKYDYLVRSRNFPLPADPKVALKNFGAGLIVAATIGAVVATGVVVAEKNSMRDLDGASIQMQIEDENQLVL